MEKAYVLIGCELGSENELVKKLLDIDKVKDAHVTYGDYDIVVEVETETERQMDNLITKKIRMLDKIRTTTTLGVVS
ncbi:MAG TPA: Lrp/AsnC ligand binding domain-containing protein [Nitrosopumilaceae archaeon]|nr:Lrp/AsnC ligand binding domain-containing protein [Nitrosopumilaceae archaeon]